MLDFVRQNRITTVLRSSHYGTYVIGNSVNLIGTWMHWVTVGWLAWQLTESPLWLGLVAFADLFPTVILGPIAGAYADRWNRLTMMKVCQAGALCQAAALFILTYTGMIEAVHLLILTFLLGFITAFNQPARLALIPSLVLPEHLNTAVGLNSAIFNLARFIGPMVAAFVIIVSDIAWVFALNTLTFIFFLTILAKIELQAPAESVRPKQRITSDLKEGLNYALTHRTISVHLFHLVTFNLCMRPLTEFLPAFADRIFSGGVSTLALLTSTFAGGAIVGGMWLAQRAHTSGLETIVVLAVYGACFAITGFVFSDSLWLALPFAGLAGVSFVLVGAGTQTLLQSQTPNDMRGRVLSLYGLVIRGGPALGALCLGWIAELAGLRWPLVLGAILAAILVWGFSRRLSAAHKA